MKQTELQTITLRYCGFDFARYTFSGNPVYKLHFVDAQFRYYEFETLPNGAFSYRTGNFTVGKFYRVSWKRYGNTWKKIAYELEPETEGAEPNEK